MTWMLPSLTGSGNNFSISISPTEKIEEKSFNLFWFVIIWPLKINCYSLVIGCQRFYSTKTQIHSTALSLVSNIVRSPIRPVEELIERDQSFLHHVQFDQHDGYIPDDLRKKNECHQIEIIKFVSKQQFKAYLWIIWWIELNNPIDGWNVQTTSSHICA